MATDEQVKAAVLHIVCRGQMTYEPTQSGVHVEQPAVERDGKELCRLLRP